MAAIDYRVALGRLESDPWRQNQIITTNNTNYINTAIFNTAIKKQFVETPVSSKDHDKEHDMALRKNFTFAYTGQEIADSLERKASKLDAKSTAPAVVDRTTVELIYPHYSPREIDSVIAEQTKVVGEQRRSFADAASRIRKEALPYAKAAKASFDMDLEDVQHFGLNDEDAPVKARRTRKPKETQPVDEVAVSA